MNFNQVTLGGTLTRKPESKFTPKGTAICEFSLAINRNWKDDAGNKKEEVAYIDCTAFGRTAEVITEYCDKGHSILISGRLSQDTWEDKQSGQKRSKIKVIVDQFQFVSKPKGDQSEAPQRQQRSQPPRPPADPDLDPEDDSQIPF